MKKLYRSRTNRTVLGILGGLGEFFGIDPVVIRVAYVSLLIFTAIFPLTLAYFVCYFIIPPEPENSQPPE